MNRRGFFYSCLAILGGAVGNHTVRSVPSDLHVLIGDLEIATNLGRAYLQSHPASTVLAFASDYAETIAPRVDESALMAWFDSRVAQELEYGDTVILNGWLLARSEALLCASMAL